MCIVGTWIMKNNTALSPDNHILRSLEHAISFLFFAVCHKKIHNLHMAHGRDSFIYFFILAFAFDTKYKNLLFNRSYKKALCSALYNVRKTN